HRDKEGNDGHAEGERAGRAVGAPPSLAAGASASCRRELEARAPAGWKPAFLPAEDVGKHEGRDDGRVRLDNVLRRIDAKLAPRDLLVRDCARIRAVGCGRIADLAEVTP